MFQGSKKSGYLKSDGLEFGEGTEHGKYRLPHLHHHFVLIRLHTSCAFIKENSIVREHEWEI